VRHALFVGVGIVAAYIAFQVPMKVWQQLAPWLFIGGAVCSCSY
jgi:cell division protein FtsW